MSKIKYNKSKTYLLPLLVEVINFNIKFMPYLINTYMFDKDDKYKDCLLILHEFFFKNPEFTAYEHTLTKSEYFVECIDLDNKVLYVFKFPKEYMIEYNYLKNSQYSKFGGDAVKLILRFWGQVLSGNPNGIPFLQKIKQIMYKDSKLKEKIEKDLKVKLNEEQELGDYVNLNDEIFNSEDFKINKIIN